MNKELIKYLKYECEDWQETKKLVKEMDDGKRYDEWN